MTYVKFQQYLAQAGFTYTPIGKAQYGKLVKRGFRPYDLYSIACDVHSGFTLGESIKAIQESNNA
tara:strand:- start:1053 stop:1247 length:195 start_codon:yes stop_codon:yes gene_type:complete